MGSLTQPIPIPDWFVQITVARDTLGATHLAVVRSDVIVSISMDVRSTPHVKPLVKAMEPFLNPIGICEEQFDYLLKTRRAISLVLNCWTVPVESQRIRRHLKRSPHKKFVELFLWCACLPVVNNPDVVVVCKPEHNFFPVLHIRVDMTGGIFICSFRNQCWECCFYEEEFWRDLCGD